VKRLIAIAGCLAFLPLSVLAKARSTGVPVFNVAPACQEARAFVGDNKTLAYQSCMKDENDARAELTRKWAKFKPQDRNDCVAQGAAPMPSYVEILTCLEMSEEAGTLYNPDGTARANPGPAKQGLSSPAMMAPAGISPTGPVPPALAAPSSPLPDLGPGSMPSVAPSPENVPSPDAVAPPQKLPE
jgi:hypothetical protein